MKRETIDTTKRGLPLAATPLFVPLKRAYFEAFESGRKTEEYRPYGPRWNERTCRIGRRVTLSMGYGKKRRMHGTITSFKASTEPTKSMAWKVCYGGRALNLAACIGITLDSGTNDQAHPTGGVNEP